MGQRCSSTTRCSPGVVRRRRLRITDLKQEIPSRSSLPFGPVIPTGAPGECRCFKSSRARSGGIPKVSPFPLPRQGVITRLPVVTRRRVEELLINEGWDSRLVIPRHVAKDTSERDRAWENSLWQHGQGRSVGIPPLRAIHSWWGQE